MAKKELEIRGISRNEIIKYLHQLGAVADFSSGFVFKGNGWSCTLAKEESFHMFQSEIPKLHLIFLAGNKETLNDIISKFRKKTFRAGG